MSGSKPRAIDHLAVRVAALSQPWLAVSKVDHLADGLKNSGAYGFATCYTSMYSGSFPAMRHQLAGVGLAALTACAVDGKTGAEVDASVSDVSDTSNADASPRTLGAFDTVPHRTMFVGRMDHASIIADGRLHVIGGIVCSSCNIVPSDVNRTTESTESAAISATGLGTFSRGPDLRYPRSGPVAFHMKRGTGNWVYVLGGVKRDSAASTGDYIQQIERAPVLADGTLGTFEVVPQLLDVGRAYAGLVVADDSVYVVGGATAHQTYTATVARTSVGPNGDLMASFVQTEGLLQVARGRGATITTSDRAFFVGGQLDGAAAASSTAVDVGGLNATGVLANLQRGTALPSARTAPVGLALGDRLWLFGGGQHGVSATAEVLSSPIDGSSGLTLSATQLPGPRSAATGVLLPDRFCLLGGSSSTSDTTVLDSVVCALLE